MHAASTIPDPGTYGRVLQRFDRDPRMAHQQRLAGYDVNLRGVRAPATRDVPDTWGGDAITMFVPVGKGNAADRAVKQGWHDVTAAWNRALGRKPDPATAQQLSALQHAVEGMEWNALRKYATDKGIDASGKRADVEARVLEWHAAQARRED
jgi:hypothetical protein